MNTSQRNPSSTINLRVPPPTIAITRRETISFPLELGDSSTGIVGYSKTIEGDNVSVRCIWSGRLTDLSSDQLRVERELAARGYELGARIADVTMSIATARLVDADGVSIAPMFIPRWSTDVRMAGETLISAFGHKVIRLSTQPDPVSVPVDLLDRVNASYQGRSPWIVTASSELRVHELDAERIATADSPTLEIEVIIRATAVPEM